MSKDTYIPRKQAAKMLGVAPATLATWKWNKRYNLPCYIKWGRCFYKIADIKRFAKENGIKL